MSDPNDLETRVSPGHRTRMTRLLRVLPPFQPRPAFHRTDWVVDQVSAVAFVPSGQELFAASVFGLQRWAIDRETPSWSVPYSGRWGAEIALSPDGTRLLTIGDDDRLVERDPSTGAERRCWRTNVHITRALAFSRDGGSLLWAGSGVPGNTGGYSLVASRLWDIASGELRWRALGRDWTSACSAGFLPGGRLVFIADGNGHFDVLSAEDGHLVHTLSIGVDQYWRGVELFRGGRAILAVVPSFAGRVCTGHQVKVWRMRGLHERACLKLPCAQVIAKSPDDRLALVSGHSNRIHLLSLHKGVREIDAIDLPDPDLDSVTALAFDPAGRTFVAGTQRGAVLWFELTGER